MFLRSIGFLLYFLSIINVHAESFISGDNVTITYSETPTNNIEFFRFRSE